MHRSAPTPQDIRIEYQPCAWIHARRQRAAANPRRSRAVWVSSIVSEAQSNPTLRAGNRAGARGRHVDRAVESGLRSSRRAAAAPCPTARRAWWRDAPRGSRRRTAPERCISRAASATTSWNRLTPIEKFAAATTPSLRCCRLGAKPVDVRDSSRWCRSPPAPAARRSAESWPAARRRSRNRSPRRRRAHSSRPSSTRPTISNPCSGASCSIEPPHLAVADDEELHDRALM